MRIRRALMMAALTTLMALPAAGAESTAAPGPDEQSPTGPFPRCRDVGPIHASPELYRDTPIYVENEQITDELVRWARTKPGFAGAWIDREHLGWVTLLFTEEVEKRQRQLERRFPDAGVVAVQATHTQRELEALQRSMTRELSGVLDAFSISQSVSDNLVHLDLAVLTDESVDEVSKRFAGEPICVDGPDPADLPLPGPQPAGGDGWQLLGMTQGPGPDYRTAIATDETAYQQMWEMAGIPGPRHAVDLQGQVAIWFAVGHGSSCPDLRLDDVIVDAGAALVYPLIVMPENPMACTDDLAGAYQFIVGLDRERLPAGPFIIGLRDSDRRGDGRPVTVVDIDLSAPGTAVQPGETRPDRRDDRLRTGAFIESIGKARYALDARCGIEHLGRINGFEWVTDQEEVPVEWQPLVDEHGEVTLTIRLRTEPEPVIRASAGGRSIDYRPTADGVPTCER